MNSSVGHIVCHDSYAIFSIHYQIHGKVLNEEDAVETKSSTKESVKHRVPCSISHSTTSICLTSSSEIFRLTSEGSLIDLSFFGSAEGHTIRLKFQDSLWCLLGHIVNSILVSEPITSLDCVIEVPSPIVLMHVSESGIDSSLFS